LQLAVVIGVSGDQPAMPQPQSIAGVEQRHRRRVGVKDPQLGIEQEKSAFRPVQNLTIGMQIRRRPFALDAGGGVGPECLCRHALEAEAGTAWRGLGLVRGKRAPSRALDERLPRSRDHRRLPFSFLLSV
jgi:hypothetical protein